jgi:alkanesulfonate monooxygenase
MAVAKATPMNDPYRTACGMEVFASMPGKFPTEDYVENAVRLTGDCERLGFTGALIHFNHRVPDPWQLASLLIERSKTFVPLVAVQPYYLSPFALAKTIATIAYMYDRPVALNMVAGSTPGALRQVCDDPAHDVRYRRLDEYLGVLQSLLANEVPFTHSGGSYEYAGLEFFAPGMAPEHLPEVFVAGSSTSAKKISARYQAIAMTNPTPVNDFATGYAAELRGRCRIGVRLGLIARETGAEAWEVARDRFPPDRRARINVMLNGQSSDSVWRRSLANLGDEQIYDGVFWTGAILAGKSHSPFLIGSHDQVAAYLARYIDCGVSRLILASPWEEYESNAETLRRANALSRPLQSLE